MSHPPARSWFLAPAHSAVALSKALTSGLTLVSAPAGYGKTTLVSSWLAESGVTTSWLSLDAGDNDPIRFLQYFLAALDAVVPGIRPDLMGVFQEAQPAPFDASAEHHRQRDRRACPTVHPGPGRFPHDSCQADPRDFCLSPRPHAAATAPAAPLPHRPAAAACPLRGPRPTDRTPGGSAPLYRVKKSPPF